MRTTRFVIALLVVLSARPALTADEPDPGFVEISHSIAVNIHDGAVAELVVRRTFANRGREREELHQTLSIPKASSAASFRVRRHGRWRSGVLRDSTRAAKTYEELAARVGTDRDGPALLEKFSSGLELRIASVAPRETVAVEYSVVAPMCYEEGRYMLLYPVAAEAAVPVLGPASGPWQVDLGSSAGAEVKGLAERCALLEDADGTVLVEARRQTSGWSASLWSTLVAGEQGGQHVVRAHVALPAALSEPPRDARVVFAIDASISQGESGLEHQLMLAAAYAAELPGARYQLVSYGRSAAAVFPAFVLGSSFVETVAAARPTMTLSNGSRLDLGLTTALALLAQQPGPQRVVAFTDEKLAAEFDGTKAVAASERSKGAVVHLISAKEGSEASFDRQDDEALAQLVAPSGGMFVHGYADENSARELMSHFVRPQQIDMAYFDFGGADPDDSPNAVPVREGSSLELFGHLGSERDDVMLRGYIWGRPFERRIVRGTVAPSVFGGLILGSDEFSLDDAATEDLAYAGGIVTALTSYLAHDPRMRPLPVPLFGIGGRLSARGYGTTSCCGFGTRRGVESPDLRARRLEALRQAVRENTGRCTDPGDRAAEVSVQVETTEHEIVDVDVSVDETQHLECVTEAVWNVHLDRKLFARPSATYAVTLGI